VATWRSFARLFEGSGRLVALSLGLALAQSAALVPIGLLVKRIFDDALPDGDRGELVLLGVTVVVLFAASAALGLLSRGVMLATTSRAVARLRGDLLGRIQTLPRAWLDRQDVAHVHSTVVADSERVGVMAGALLGVVVPAAVVGAALLASLAFVDLGLLAILLAVMPVLVVFGRWLNHRATRLVQRFQAAFDVFSARVLGNLRSALTIRAQGAEAPELRAGLAEIGALGEESRRLATAWHLYAAVQGTTAAVGGMLVLVAGGLRVIDGGMSLGALLSFVGVLGIVRGQITPALTWLPQVAAGRESLVRLERLLGADAEQPYRGDRAIAFSGRLEVEDVTFGYGEAPVLRELSLSLAPGERVALSGPNGAGKSTLVALVLGLYRPHDGRLLADGVAYDDLDLAALRRRVGVLLQDPVLFRGSVRDNVAFGAPEATGDEVRAALAAACADEVVAALPAGLETEVGTDGELLSGGQRQRIALARALLGRPPLLVLDEPSSHLDDETTARLLDSLRELEWTPAILLITHDPTVARLADRVVELRDGKVAAPA
jgi:ATP-binding cassette subfamily B protein